METLSNLCFADQFNRKYPIHTKEAAYNSYKEYCGDKANFSEAKRQQIEENFTKAASFHEIKLEEPQIKLAAGPELHILGEEGAEEAVKMPLIKSVEDVNAAAAFLLEKRASMACKSLREAAKYVLWAASNSKEDLETPEMRKIAALSGTGTGDKEDILDQFDKRGTLLAIPTDQVADFWAFSRKVHEIPDEEFYKMATLEKICDTMDDIDRAYGLNHQYGKKIGDSVLKSPEDACFGQNLDDLTKEASDMLYVPSIETILSKEALAERTDKVKDFFQTYFGEEKPFEGTEMTVKVASLDKNTANALLDYIKD